MWMALCNLRYVCCVLYINWLMETYDILYQCSSESPRRESSPWRARCFLAAEPQHLGMKLFLWLPSVAPSAKTIKTIKTQVEATCVRSFGCLLKAGENPQLSWSVISSLQSSWLNYTGPWRATRPGPRSPWFFSWGKPHPPAPPLPHPTSALPHWYPRLSSL